MRLRNFERQASQDIAKINEGYLVEKNTEQGRFYDDNNDEYRATQESLSFEQLATLAVAKSVSQKEGNYVFSSTESIKPPYSKEIAFSIIAEGYFLSVGENISKFKTEDRDDIIFKLIELNQYVDREDVVEYLSKFKELDAETAMRLIGSVRGDALAESLSSFKDINHQEIAIKMIEANQGYYVAYYLKNFKDVNHQEIAFRLIETGQGRFVARFLPDFKDLNHQEIARRLIEKDEVKSVSQNILNFKNLNNEIVFELIELSDSYYIVSNLSNFESLNHQETASKLIEFGQGKYVARFLSDFEDLNHQEIASRLIEAGVGSYVAENLPNFKDINHQDLAFRLIEFGQGESVAINLQYFKGLNQDLALKLIELKQGYYVAANLSSFRDLNHQEIASKLVELGQGESVARYLKNFKDLNQDLALKLIELKQGYYVAANLSSFRDLNHQEIASKLVELGHGESVARYLKNFKDINHQDIAFRLIELGKSEFVASYLSNFENLNSEIALRLIEQGESRSVTQHFSSFEGLDHSEVAIKLIERGYGYAIISTKIFKNLSQQVLTKFIEMGQSKIVAEYLSSFKNVDHQEIASRLIEIGQSDIVRAYLKNFKGLNPDLALKLIELRQGNYVAANLSSFRDLDHQEIASKLVELGQGESVALYLKNFERLSNETAIKLIELGNGEVVAKGHFRFVGLNYRKMILKLIEFKQSKSAAVHLQNFRDLDNEIAIKLIESGEGSSVADNVSSFKDINYQEIAFKLIEFGQGGYLARNIKAFNNLDHQEIVKRLIERGNGVHVAQFLPNFKDINHQDLALRLIELGKSEFVASYLSNFENLNSEIALRLIELQHGVSVAKYLPNFKNINHQEIANKLIESGAGKSVADNLSNFKDLNHQEIASRLIEVNLQFYVAKSLTNLRNLNQDLALKLIEFKHGDYVAAYLSSFRDLNHQEIASKLIETGQGDFVAKYLLNFKDINHQDLASRLIELGHGESIAKYLPNFKDINHQDLASRLIELGKSEFVASYLSNFENLNSEIALRLIELDKGSFIASNLSSFKDINSVVAIKLIKLGFTTTIARHLPYFKDLSQEIAFKLIEENKNQDIIDNLSSFENVTKREIAIKLIEGGKILVIINSHDKFGEHIKSLPFLKEIYKLQPPSKNENNDPWTQHLVPLLEAAGDLKDEKVRQIILKYIKVFGLVYESHLFDIFKKIVVRGEIDENTKVELRSFKINPNLQRDSILLELNKVAKAFTSDILSGLVPDSLDTSLGNALFVKEFVPQSSFDRGYINWKELGNNANENYQVPAAIRTQERKLVEKGEIKLIESEGIEAKRQAILSNKETVTRFESFKGYIEDTNNGFTVFNVQEAIQKRINSQNELILTKNPIKDRMIIDSIQKSINRDLLLLDSLEEVVQGVTGEGELAEYSAMYAKLTELSLERKNKEESLNRFFRAYVLTEIMETNPGLKVVFNGILEKRSIDIDSLHKLSDFTSHLINHEFLDKEDNNLSDVVKARIRALLMAEKTFTISSGKNGGDVSIDYFTKVLRDLEKIDSPNGDMITSIVQFTPVSGLGRITAGNVGNACHTSQTQRLSDGDFQNTHVMMIAREGKDKDKHIVGSVLGIKAQQRNLGTPVYVIRANNPQENYLSSIDVDSYVEASIQAMIQQAVDIRNENISQGSGGNIKVCLPMEIKSNASMTNRPRVHERMYKKFSSCKPVALNNNDDTNFNGYPIWDEKGDNKVVCIYEIKDGTEYYYGTHGEKIQHNLINVSTAK